MPKRLYVVPGARYLVKIPGNIDLLHRRVARNSDGTISTVRSIYITFDNAVVLLPTVINGRVVSNSVAIANYRKTGQHLGIFATVRAAKKYGDLLHQEQEKVYANFEMR